MPSNLLHPPFLSSSRLLVTSSILSRPSLSLSYRCPVSIEILPLARSRLTYSYGHLSLPASSLKHMSFIASRLLAETFALSSPISVSRHSAQRCHLALCSKLMSLAPAPTQYKGPCAMRRVLPIQAAQAPLPIVARAQSYPFALALVAAHNDVHRRHRHSFDEHSLRRPHPHCTTRTPS